MSDLIARIRFLSTSEAAQYLERDSIIPVGTILIVSDRPYEDGGDVFFGVGKKWSQTPRIAKTTYSRVRSLESAPPSHMHIVADVAGLQSALENRSLVGHEHVIDDVTGLQSSLENRSLIGHEHVIDDVVSLQSVLDSKAASSHEHEMGDIINLVATLSGINNDIIDLNTALGNLAASPPVVELFTSNGTWNRPANCIGVFFFVHSAGGGGGRPNSTSGSQAAVGNGGGAGAWALRFQLNPDASYAITVGQGGEGETQTDPAENGGSSSVGSLVSATGGSAGSKSIGSANIVWLGNTTAPGSPSGGNVLSGRGEFGLGGFIQPGVNATGGNGGSSILGAGAVGNATTSSASGRNGNGYGAGGSGASAGPNFDADAPESGTIEGGDGSNGIVAAIALIGSSS